MEKKQRTLLQGFEWYLPEDQYHWQKIAELAPLLKQIGFTSIWLPPAYKGLKGEKEVGYAPYDLYDLGEFQQQGTIATKYGTKDEYLACIHALKENDLEVLADIVFDHFMGADEKEEVLAERCKATDREAIISKQRMIEARTKFTFSGRKGKYDNYQWSWKNFSGVDYDDKQKEEGIFKFVGKKWNSPVDNENANFDYLMGCNLDMTYPETIQQLDNWGKWYQSITDIDGYRFDAVKHIKFDFFNQWLLHRRKEKEQELFIIGEYWNNDLQKLENYIDQSGALLPLFDIPLHYNFYEAAKKGNQYDLRKLLVNTLVDSRPEWAITFVENHDTQEGQSLESWVLPWFKPMAYAIILLLMKGTPVVFWGDLFGIPAKKVEKMGQTLIILLKIRQQIRSNYELTYFDDPTIVGWTHVDSLNERDFNYAVIMSNDQNGSKQMCIGTRAAHKNYIDILGNHHQIVRLNEVGIGNFYVKERSLAVYVEETVAKKLLAEVEQLDIK
ncbi:alpha-amylase [Melissococcus plutonius]|uniref:Cytoplasmic alpha-amylase n=1 Tax=Melissococcus plutonius (strain ATCC 35311 / DSM 29964 / CIP 104052 / LMG 20360 / NCIMB 702443) TaxID=940190 RepID=F3Y9E9_MELPT|nr:alpha-amylase [Melissococcus plutonius]AIM24683.1 alpha-amylase AmyS [Melissococcus plutonius S1]KMT24787.1 alpha-amylase AmyS [Melissococcus plutonius]KMT26424.1 alpha-amylase AmyS [Melissococcus plutonius]KMT27674.1 alpha-amylase AmyS [Melissococcus plutonius]KMT29446.1 alpha-amylase AmyS [Melissococcus plutonius]